jgi:hypothetical protein
MEPHSLKEFGTKNNKIRQNSRQNIFFVYSLGVKQLSFKYAAYV